MIVHAFHEQIYQQIFLFTLRFLCFYLLQPPPVEQGGVLQRSSFPQQVLPPCVEIICPRFERLAVERTFSRLLAPQTLHLTISLSLFPTPTKYSEMAPHSLHLYSYIGINTSYAFNGHRYLPRS